MRTRPPWTARLPALAAAALLAAGSTPLRAQLPLMRRFGTDAGLVAPPVWALAQDATGFLWIGTEAGLVRFDGTEMLPWAADSLRASVRHLAAGPGGELIAVTREGDVVAVTAHGAAPVALPGHGRLRAVAFARDGALWFARDSTLGCIRRGRSCGSWGPGSPSGGPVRRLVGADSGVLAVNGAGVWRVGSDGPRLVLRRRYVVDAAELNGQVAALADGGVIVLGDGTSQRTLAGPAVYGATRPRGISLVARGDVLWASLDRFLVRVRPGEPPVLLASADGIESGGPLLVDREQALWLGMFTGLLQLPEPGTQLWDDRHGLPSRHTRFLAAAGGRIWVATWQGLGTIDPDPAGWRATSHVPVVQSRLCRDAAGRVWFGTDGGFAVYTAGRGVVSRPRAPIAVAGCATRADSTLWLATRGGLLRTQPTSLDLVPVPLAGLADSVIDAVLWDAADRLWIASGAVVCRTHRLDGAAPAAVARCERLHGAARVTALAEVDSGRIWAATEGRALLERTARGWTPVAGAEPLPTGTIFGLVPSPRGGWWVLGHGAILRVLPTAAGWALLERLGGWHGVAASGASDLLELDDGAIWIATELGVTRVPASARFAPVFPPPVAVVGVWTGDRRLAADSAIALPHDRASLVLRFAALSYRDPRRLRYQLRLNPDEPWSAVSGSPSFRWSGLAPGRYEPAVRASLDGITWSAVPARIGFSVVPPWYRHPAATVAFAGAAALLLWLGYRARLAYLLGLERERTRIAMDLHDTIGSGLGSIGLLSGVLATRDVAPDERRRLTGDIAVTAEELGNALSDILWSLDRHATTLPELASRLVEHGARLDAAGAVRFTATLAPDLPRHPLPLAVRRNVLLIGFEALHNAVRHSNAKSVRLGLAPAGDGWCLTVEDDGRGIGADERENGDGSGTGGRGVRGMRARAADIGARLVIDAVPGGGTIVQLDFATRLPLRAKLARLRRRTAALT